MDTQYNNLLPRKIYFSDNESTVREHKVTVGLLNGDEVDIAVSKSHLGELSELEGRLNFRLIVDESNLKKSALLGLYKNQDNLRTYYIETQASTLKRNYLVILSFGESQPTKYTLQIESVWQVIN